MLVHHLQKNQDRLLIQILKMMLMLVEKEDGMVEHQVKNLIFLLLLRLILSALNLEEYKLTFNKHRLSSTSSTLKKELRKISYVDLIMTKCIETDLTLGPQGQLLSFEV